MAIDALSQRLKTTFGYDAFRPLQREIMDVFLGGRDALAVLPTGAGKSLCYQLPALVRDGLTVVVSPLIALMKDQVDQLEASGVSATFINSTLEGMELRRRLDGLDRGKYQLLYAAPERLMLPDFLSRLREWKVIALAVDEAHCISEWGHDFRPEYRRLREVRTWTGDIPILALTATATERVREDIVRQLVLREPALFLASFNRPNLKYSVVAKSGAAVQVCEFARARPQESGIVYCQSRKSTESLASTLVANGISALPYHAGLEPETRAKNQDAFLRDEVRVVCATIAFGMGINKPNVRYVIHADLPKNIEGYYQETGRAGRDGLPADCLLLFSRGDVMKYSRFIYENPEEQAREVARLQLKQITHFAEDDACRRIGLMGYFGEKWTTENCGGCDVCLEPREKWDATVDVQKFLSCVLRIRQAGRFEVGINHISEVLTGGQSEKLLRWKHDQLTTYGIGKDQPRAYWVDIGRQLLRRGLLAASSDAFATVSVSATGLAALKDRTSIPLRRPIVAAKVSATNRSYDIPYDSGLFEELRILRKQLADARDVPAYVIFSDVTLRLLSREYPTDETALLRISGVGQKKREEYGGAFLQAIRDWLQTHPREKFAPLAPAVPAPLAPVIQTGLSGTAQDTMVLWWQGKSIAEIAKIRVFTESTIEKHLAEAIEGGEKIDPRLFYTEAEEQEMRRALEGYEELSLKPVFDQLEGRVSYGKLRLYRAISSRE